MVEPTKLKTQPERADFEQPGCDVSFETTIGEGRVLRMHTTFFQNTPLDVQKKLVREMLSISDHEKAHYELIDLRWDLGLKEKSRSRCEEDVSRIDEKNAAVNAKKIVEINELKLQLAERAAAHENAFRNTGRQGSFKRSTSQMAELRNIQADIDRLQAEVDGGPEANQRRDIMTGLARLKNDIQMVKDEIAKRRMILGMPEEASE